MKESKIEVKIITMTLRLDKEGKRLIKIYFTILTFVQLTFHILCAVFSFNVSLNFCRIIFLVQSWWEEYPTYMPSLISRIDSLKTLQRNHRGSVLFLFCCRFFSLILTTTKNINWKILSLENCKKFPFSVFFLHYFLPFATKRI